MPEASLEIVRSGKSFSSRTRYDAVASPSVSGSVARMTSWMASSCSRVKAWVPPADGGGTVNALAIDTEAAFRDDPQVLMCSFFQHPFYPYSGDQNPAPNMVNVPVPAYTRGMDIRELIDEDAVAQRSHLVVDLRGQFLQAVAHQLVVIAAQRVAGHVGAFAIV